MSTDADMALRSVIRQAEASKCASDFDYAYLAGQVAIITVYFSPDAQLLEKARQAVAALIRKSA